MFVQVIEGQVADRGALRRQFDRWGTELQPGATGYLGTTAGVTDDGLGIAVARFASADAAKANSARPEQGAWWTETARCYEGEVTFADSEDVDEFLAGGSNEAGFVQVMKAEGADRGRVGALDKQLEEIASSFRPDLIGGLRIWTGPGSYVEVAYFTSEAAAREGEQKELPAEFAGEVEAVMGGVTFLDLREPWLF